MDRATADYCGMLATVLNARRAAGRARARGHADARAVGARRSPRSPSRTSAGARSATSRRAASSSSRPAPATRSSRPTRRAALRACEIGAQALLMAKNGVDGVYDADPAHRRRRARFLPEVSHREALERQLQGDGRDGALALHGERHADLRLQRRRRRQHRARGARRGHRHGREHGPARGSPAARGPSRPERTPR